MSLPALSVESEQELASAQAWLSYCRRRANHHSGNTRERRPTGRAFVPGQIGSGESAIRQFAIDLIEGKRPELLAILADINLHGQPCEGNGVQDQAVL